jgi:hypothetical protein
MGVYDGGHSNFRLVLMHRPIYHTYKIETTSCRIWCLAVDEVMENSTHLDIFDERVEELESGGISSGTDMSMRKMRRTAITPEPLSKGLCQLYPLPLRLKRESFVRLRYVPDPPKFALAEEGLKREVKKALIFFPTGPENPEELLRAQKIDHDLFRLLVCWNLEVRVVQYIIRATVIGMEKDRYYYWQFSFAYFFVLYSLLLLLLQRFLSLFGLCLIITIISASLYGYVFSASTFVDSF